MKSEEILASVLHARNRAIIDAVIAKAKKVCPGALDLVAVTGSFASGDFYEHSDLDLLIVINHPGGLALAKCFILGEVAHDIYCHTWGDLKECTDCGDPYLGKLLDAEIIYAANEKTRQKYMRLRRLVRRTMSKPLDNVALYKIDKHVKRALQSFARMCMADGYGDCHYHAAGVRDAVECAVYLLNRAYVRHGVRGIPQEICALPLLPDHFAEEYRNLIEAGTPDSMRCTARSLIGHLEKMIAEISASTLPPDPITSSNLRGTYEEIHSNWRSKMHRAADEGDAYLSWVTAASCQAFYDDMAQRHSIPRVELFWDAPPRDLREAAARFDAAMEQYLENYTQTGTEICRYDSVEDFVADYLK